VENGLTKKSWLAVAVGTRYRQSAQGVPLEANFGDNPAKPFSFDIAKCPRLVFP
jgi:hypothetical protein